MNTADIAGSPVETLRQLVPMAHVEEMERSIKFYGQLGFKVSNADGQPGSRGWAWLTNGRAHLMLLRSDRPMNPAAQDVLFYLYATDVVEYRSSLMARGVEVGPLTHPEYLPKGEFRMTDPDGYCLAVGQWEDDWFGY